MRKIGDGVHNHTLYSTYHNMRTRCFNTNNPDYKHYGGRGITVCDRWMGKDGFLNFVADVGEKPSPKHSIDRIDNDGNYEPSNCKWSLQVEQVTNQRLRKDNKSGVKGVYWKERDRRWIAQARVNGKTVYIGSFLTKEDAVKVRIKYIDAGQLKGDK